MLQCTYCMLVRMWCNTLKPTFSAQSSTSSGCQNNQRVKFVYGPDHREQRIHMPGGMANLLVQSLITCSTQIWRGKASEISSHVVMSSRQRVDVQGVGPRATMRHFKSEEPNQLLPLNIQHLYFSTILTQPWVLLVLVEGM